MDSPQAGILPVLIGNLSIIPKHTNLVICIARALPFAGAFMLV